jgi:hypothetical protein
MASSIKFKDLQQQSIFDDFDASNITPEQLEHLKAQVYQGFKTGEKPRYEMRGAGDGRGYVQNGTTSYTDFEAYKDGPWEDIATQIGITGAINKKTELAAMYDYVQNYGRDKEPAAPMPEAVETEEPAQAQPIKLSNRAAKGNAGAQAYEDVLLNKQGDAFIKGNKSVEQQYKNAYQSNLSEELKVKDPSTFAATKAKYQMADQQAANLNDNFDLNLGNSNLFS